MPEENITSSDLVIPYAHTCTILKLWWLFQNKYKTTIFKNL